MNGVTDSDIAFQAFLSAELISELPRRAGREKLPADVYAEIIRRRLFGAKPELSWLRERAYAELKPTRIPHVQGCERMAVRLAERWGEDVGDAAESAILHDITKRYKGAEQLLLCDKYGIILCNADKEAEPILHAETGAERARELFGVTDAVWGAIRWHTTGRPEMTRLEQILYLADAAEETRDYPGVETLRTLAFADLREAMICGLEMSLAVVKKRGNTPHPATAESLNWFMEHREQ